MSEFELIASLRPYLAAADQPAGEGAGVVVGHGDDAAVLDLGGRPVVVTVDVVVEGVHFRRDLSGLADAGWKAVAVNASDLAAMGARPAAAVVGLCRPAAVSAADVRTLYEGMAAAGDRWGLRLVGGDTVAGEQLVVSVTALGTVGPAGPVLRSGARPGDRVVVVGALGAAAAALAQADAGLLPDEALLRAHRRPAALVASGAVLAAHGATAMIDVSDGLGADLGHVCAASNVSAEVAWEALPVAAGVAEAASAAGADLVRLVCGGGEDFALLATLPADAADAAARAAGEAEQVPAAVVGEVRPAQAPPRVTLALGGGRVVGLDRVGFDHYPAPRRGVRRRSSRPGDQP